MALHSVVKGLDLPISGAPAQVIEAARAPGTVGVVALDYVGLRPRLHVGPGDAVKRGQLLFEDKKTRGVRYTAPGAGVVTAVNRGARRALESVVIELNENERGGVVSAEDACPFASYTGKDVVRLGGDEVCALLLESGLWAALRTRPFSKVADPGTRPAAIFVNAMDTNPLAPRPEVVLAGQARSFEIGLLCVAKLTEGRRYLCKAPGAAIPVDAHSGFLVEEFSGPHPAGLVGTHIHTLAPVHREKTVWHLDYQDVIAIGRLIETGALPVERVVSLAGPPVRRPRLLRTRLGASLGDLVRGELHAGEHRVISGSVLSGRSACGDVLGYLGRYHCQISVLDEDRRRVFLGWLRPGLDAFSVLPVFLSRFFGTRRFAFTTSTNGSRRAIVPIGLYERVMPLDLLPTFLLRALSVGDLDRAEALGCLELDEEDLTLCSFVCPGKGDYGGMLREVLTALEKEG